MDTHISILYIITFLFFLITCLTVLQWTTIWQIKEYRVDRMKDFFTTVSGRRALFDTTLIIAIIGTIFSLQFDPVWMIPLLLCCVVVLLRKRVQPQWTGKALLIVGATLLGVFIIGALLLFLFDALIAIPLLIALTPVAVSIVVALLHPVTVWQRARIISQAKEKIQSLETTVIGITGSFGKSTTKEFLRAMIAQRYSVLATPKNINVDIGVAQVILSELQPEHDFFIVEMGAYRIGEIEAICQLTSPIIGVLTAVNPQHLSLFGSLEAIKIAKGELLRALPKGGLAVINKDIPDCVEMAEQSGAQVKFFSSQQFSHAYASDVVVHPDRVECVLHIGDESAQVTIPLFGKQVLSSVLAAATVARHVGCTMQEIVEAIQHLEPVDGTMHVKQGKYDTTVIDDHYNSNPDGFLAALDYQAVFSSQRKIVITPGMYELAEASNDKHHTVGSRIAEVADILLITKDDFAEHLEKGAKSAGMPAEQIYRITSPKKVIDWLHTHVKANDVILLEGRVHERIVNYLLHN